MLSHRVCQAAEGTSAGSVVVSGCGWTSVQRCWLSGAESERRHRLLESLVLLWLFIGNDNDVTVLVAISCLWLYSDWVCGYGHINHLGQTTIVIGYGFGWACIYWYVQYQGTKLVTNLGYAQPWKYKLRSCEATSDFGLFTTRTVYRTVSTFVATSV